MEQVIKQWTGSWKGILLFMAWTAIVMLAGNDSLKMKERLIFTDELVRITLDGPRKKAFVDSAMLYRNISDKNRKIKLFYPTYFSEFQSAPFSITVETAEVCIKDAESAFNSAYEVMGGENSFSGVAFTPLKTEMHSSGIFADIQTGPGNAGIVRIRYSQDLKINKDYSDQFFGYNLTNSAGWGRPIDRGLYVISGDPSIKILDVYAGIKNNRWYRRKFDHISGISRLPQKEEGESEETFPAFIFEGKSYVDPGLTIMYNRSFAFLKGRTPFFTKNEFLPLKTPLLKK